MAPLAPRLKGHARLSAAFENVFEKKGKSDASGIKKATTRAAARAAARADGGKYKCGLCKKGFSRRSTVFDPHFAHCVRKNGNPNCLAWDEDPSCWKKNDGPSGVIAPGLDENNQPFNRNSTYIPDENAAMTQFYMGNKHKIDSPIHPVFHYAEYEQETEEGMDLESEPSSADTTVTDGAFIVKGNPNLIAEAIGRAPETPFNLPQAVPKVVRQEVYVPASNIAMPPPQNPFVKGVPKDMDARGLVTHEAAPDTETIDPRLLASRKYPNKITASGFAFDAFRYMVGNPSKAVHHDLHGKKPAAGFTGKISEAKMHKITNLVIRACVQKAAGSEEDAVDIFKFFKSAVNEDISRLNFRNHPNRPPITVESVENQQARPLSPALGRAHRVQMTTYMVQDVYALMLKHADTLMEQMQILCLWRDVLSALGAHIAVQTFHIVLSRELGEAMPMLLEAVEKFNNVI